MKSWLPAALFCSWAVLCASIFAQQPALPVGPGEFLVAGEFQAGTGAVSVASGDFNGDGKLDLAVANSDVSSQNISILLGNGDGTFQPQTLTAMVTQPVSVVTADFNQDGKLDIAAVANNGSQVLILFGNGNGTFQTPVSVSTAAGCFYAVAADINNDGHQDLAVACSSGVSILLGNGNGTFQTFKNVGYGGTFLALADVNGDGKLDLVIPNGFNTIAVLLGNGDGTFQAPQFIANSGCPTYVAAADFNGDGKLDLVTGNSCSTFLGNNNVSIILGNGDGTFQTPMNFNAGSDSSYFIAAADFNGDGKPDVAAINSINDTVSILLGNGDGTLQPYTAFSAGPIPKALTVADFNGDHHADIVVANQNSSFSGFFPGSVSMLLGRGDGTFQASRAFRVGAPGPNTSASFSVSAGDLNGDHKLDLVAPNYAVNTVSVLLGNGDGTFQDQSQLNVGSHPTGAAIGDLNGDGKPDLVVTNQCGATTCGTSDGTVSILIGNGDGTFMPATSLTVPGNPSSVVLADFNADGKLDLAVADTAGDVSIMLGNGNGTFGAIQNFPIPGGSGYILTGDFNNDGKLDLVVTTPNQFQFLLGNGDGTFQPYVTFNGGGAAAAAADFNGDGNLDLAVAIDGSSGGVNVFLGNGNGTFQPSTFYQTGAGNTYVLAADVNGDGVLDLALCSHVNDALEVLIGNGNGTFQAPSLYPLGFGANAMAAGDFNGDGAVDFAAAYYAVNNGFDADSLQIILNTGGTTIALTSSVSPSAFGQPVTFTATIKPAVPIIGRAGPTGTVTFMDGTTTLGTGALSGGIAKLTTNKLIVGSHSIKVIYGGDGNYNPNVSGVLTQLVHKASTTTTVTSSLNPSLYEQSVTFTATVAPQFAGIPGGSVTFMDGSATLGTGTLNSGKATFTTAALTGGSHSITGIYSGSGSFLASTSAVLTQVVNPASSTTAVVSSLNPSVFGQSVTFRATVMPQFGGTPTGTVTFKDGTTTLGTGTLSGGKASFATTKLAAGTHSITAVYGGDTNFTGSTSPAITQTVNKSSSTTAVTSSANPSVFGQTVKFTATVTTQFGGAATGTVTFKDGTTTLGTGTLSGGTAAFSTAKLGVGSHSITAVYAGDSNVNGSTSPVLTQTVNKASTRTSVTSSMNPSVSGQSVTFTATVAPQFTGTPSGSVTFKDGSTKIGTGTLSSGKATFTTSTLSVGTHSITAVYAGDTHFTGSTSPVLTQTVNP